MTKLPPGTQFEIRNCVYCRDPFQPKRANQAFCGTPCRSGFHEDHGAEGTVVSVMRLKRGRVSIVTHYEEGPAAEHAIAMLRGDRIRLVKQPKIEK